MIRQKMLRILMAASVLAMLAATPSARAADIPWDGSDGAAWATGANWNGDAVPKNDTTSDTAVFSGTPTANQPHVGSGRTVAAVNFESAGWAIGSNAGSELILGATSGMDSSGAGTNKVNTSRLRAQGGTWNIAGGNTLEINSAVTWRGTTQFSGNGTTAGDVVFNATAADNPGALKFATSGGVPTVHLGANDALGTGTILLSRSTTFRALDTSISLNNAITHEVTGGTFALTGGHFTIKKTVTIGGGGSSTTPRSLSVGTDCRVTLDAGVDTRGRRVDKTGNGTLELLGSSSLNSDGTTDGSSLNATAGVLLVNGTITSTAGTGGTVTATAGATLGGTGRICLLGGCTVTVDGTLAPGDPNANSGIGRLTIGSESASTDNNLTLGAGSTFAAQLNGPSADTAYDQLTLFGNLALSTTGSGVGLDVALGYDAAVGDTFVLVDRPGSGTTSGTFGRLNGEAAALSEGAGFQITNPVLGNKYTFRISYAGGDGNDIVLAVTEKSRSGKVIVLR